MITVTRIPDNCVQSLVVSRERRDGVFIQLNVASCLAWDGQANKAAPPALSEEQAVAVVDDERLGLEIPEKVAAEGAQRFPDLPTID